MKGFKASDEGMYQCFASEQNETTQGISEIVLGGKCLPCLQVIVYYGKSGLNKNNGHFKRLTSKCTAGYTCPRVTRGYK